MPVKSEAPVYAGERIRAVRLLVGSSQADLAASLGVTQALISQIESGRRTATATFLDQVADTTGYPRAYFEAVPADLPPLTLRFRRKATALSSEVHRAEQLVAETYRVVWQLVPGPRTVRSTKPAIGVRRRDHRRRHRVPGHAGKGDPRPRCRRSHPSRDPEPGAGGSSSLLSPSLRPMTNLRRWATSVRPAGLEHLTPRSSATSKEVPVTGNASPSPTSSGTWYFTLGGDSSLTPKRKPIGSQGLSWFPLTVLRSSSPPTSRFETSRN